MKRQYLSAFAGLPRPVYALFAARLVNSMGCFIAPLLTLILTQKLGAAKAEAGTVVAMQIFTQWPCVLLGGRLADTLGGKKTLLFGSLAGALCYLVCGCGLTGRPMVVFIILAADCTALTMPASDALLADLTAPEQRKEAYSLLYLGINLGMAASPILGGLLFKSHLPLLFLLDAATTFAAAAIILRGVPDARRVRGEPDGGGPSSLSGALRAAPVLLFFVLLAFLYDFCYSQWNFLLPAEFGDLFGADGARRYSVLSSVNAVTVIAVTPLLTRLTKKTRPLRIIALAGLFFAAGYLGFAAGGPYAAYIVLAAVFTLGEICDATQSGAFLSTHSPASCLGRVSAFFTMARGAASALGPLLMGQFLRAGTYPAAWLLIAAIVLSAALGFLLLDHKTN